MPRVLITGGAGFIGRHCAQRFVELGWNVRLFDHLSLAKDDEILKMGCSIHIGDIRDKQAVDLAMQDCEVVIHLAALVSVPESIKNPKETFDVNVTGTRNVLESAQKMDMTHAIFASSAAVYGNQRTLPLNESAVVASLSPYGESKIINENDVEKAQNDGLNAISLRFFNVYGHGQSIENGYASLIPLFIDAMVQGNQPTIFGNGAQTRDFIHVGDLANAIAELASTSKPFSDYVVNIASQTQTTVLDVFKTINRHLVQNYGHEKIEPIFLPPRKGDVVHSFGSISRLKTIIEWQPRVNFEYGLYDLVDMQKRRNA
jgi:UDP-glucose 4-epimerase